MAKARYVCVQVQEKAIERQGKAGEIQQSSWWSAVDRRRSVMELVQAGVSRVELMGAFKLARWSMLVGASFLRHSSLPHTEPRQMQRGALWHCLCTDLARRCYSLTDIKTDTARQTIGKLLLYRRSLTPSASSGPIVVPGGSKTGSASARLMCCRTQFAGTSSDPLALHLLGRAFWFQSAANWTWATKSSRLFL